MTVASRIERSDCHLTRNGRCAPLELFELCLRRMERSRDFRTVRAMRRGLKIAGLVVAAVTVAAAGLSARGSKRTSDGPQASAPDWAHACFERSPRPDRTVLHRCARVRGRVLHVERRPNDEL